MIAATATQNLSSFDLDLRGFTISRLDVNGRAATFVRDGQELVITPRAGSASGRRSGSRSTTPACPRSSPIPRVDRGLDPDRRRRVRRRRAAGLAGLVPGQRQSARQGDVRLRASPFPPGSRRWPTASSSRTRPRRQDDLGLAGDAIRWPPTSPPRRSADSTSRSRRRRRGSRPTSPSTRSSAKGQVLGKLPDGRRVLHVPLRPVSVQRGRSDRRQREGGRLLARDTDEAGLPGCPTRRRSSTSSRTCGSATR